MIETPGKDGTCMDTKNRLAEELKAEGIDCLCLIKRLFYLLENINANLELKVAIEQELLDCLCPVEPPPGAECGCFVTGGGNGTLPNDATPPGARGSGVSLGLNVCPGCNFKGNVTFTTEIDGSTQTLLGRELISLTCNETTAEIEGSGTFGAGSNRQDVTFTLFVAESSNSFSLTIRNLADVIIFATGANPVALTGQGIDIRDCP